MKKGICLLAVLVLLLSSWGTAAIASTGDQWEPYYTAIAKMEGPNWLNLTPRQMEEDFEHLYTVLDENYPFFGVAQRTTGNDLRESYKAFLGRIARCESDAEFFVEVMRYINLADGAGHLGIIWYDEDAQGNEKYTKTRDAVLPVIRHVEQNLGQASGYTGPNVTTRIIEEGKTAYISIRSFNPSYMEEDEKILFDFYQQVTNYDNLIIDITENGGGGMGYYWDLIVRPNIDAPIESINFAFLKDGTLNRQHFGADYDYRREDIPVGGTSADVARWIREHNYYSNETMEILRSLSYPPREMNLLDWEDLDYYSPAVMRLSPSTDQKLYNGKIWVLTSGRVYSASESFVNLCQNTGFATLVGTQTGGDGIGSTPVVFHLPNSGIQLRYAPIYGTTIDGRNSEEFGTTPDYPSPAGESPLDTCLRIIRENA